jgi:hypothetical protein
MKRMRIDTLGRMGRGFARPAMRRSWRRAAASLRAPAQRWSLGRRLMAYVALAAGAFVLVTAGWRGLRSDRPSASAASIETLEQRLRDGRAKLAQLPRMREAALAQAATSRAGRPEGGAVHAVADLAALAASTAVTLKALEPASGAGAASHRNGGQARALRLDGRTDFAGLYAFLQGLSTLPQLVVPETVSVKRESGGLAFVATLNVFDAVPARQSPPAALTAAGGPARGGQAGPLVADPFVADIAARQTDASVSRLVGLVRDATRSLAVFEGARGMQAALVAPGQALGAERVVRIDAGGVILASRGGERRIALREAGR